MKAIRIGKYVLPVVVLLSLLGSVWVAKAAGVWQTSGRGEVMVDESGRPDPEGIKGWMTLADVSENYAVPLDALYTMIGAAADLPADTEMKELEGLLPGAGVSTVRAGVAAYLDGSWAPSDGQFSGEAPAELEPTPEPTATPTPAPEHTPQGSGEGLGDGTGEGFSLPTDGSRLAADEIKGRMTLQEVVDACQVPLDYLAEELGLAAGVDTGLMLRDLADAYGIEVTAVRDAVQRYQEDH